MPTSLNKRKIINDPVYGFIAIPSDLIFDVIEHPWFQRLRRIKQLGLTQLVYPGALHTRFHHAIGAMHLMQQAIDSLRLKGQEITSEEANGALLAILLHDIGHGPYSHALEHSIVHGMDHEELSMLFIRELNTQFGNQLETALAIFSNRYPKRFLHQLVASQLDMDRLDYLKRDSFFTGVSEGVISTDRIIKMLNVSGDELVVEAKGIYSVEKFIIARRLMYWQVYFHKTVLSAEQMIIKLLQRAQYLAQQNIPIFATPAFLQFLQHNYSASDFRNNPDLLDAFSRLDDFDILTSMKVWCGHEDKILSSLSCFLIERRLFALEISNIPLPENRLADLRLQAARYFEIALEDAGYFVFEGTITNNAYDPTKDKIHILNKDGSITDIAEASDQLNVSVLSAPVSKYYVGYPKELRV
ncbi:MAG: HD domain-containing protein [Bacteroidales bacterium]|nr:HD domain-containing protein [Bacteroidales bacterium]